MSLTRTEKMCQFMVSLKTLWLTLIVLVLTQLMIVEYAVMRRVPLFSASTLASTIISATIFYLVFMSLYLSVRGIIKTSQFGRVTKKTNMSHLHFYVKDDSMLLVRIAGLYGACTGSIMLCYRYLFSGFKRRFQKN